VVNQSKFSDEDRRRVLAEARRNIERRDEEQPTSRISDLKSYPPPKPRAASEWTLPAPEPPPIERKLDTVPVDWARIIDQRVATARGELAAEFEAGIELRQEALLQGMGEAFRDALDALSCEFKNALDRESAKRDVELANIRVEVAKLAVEVAKGGKNSRSASIIDADDDLSPRRIN
jgi:hypothetical protein